LFIFKEISVNLNKILETRLAIAYDSDSSKIDSSKAVAIHECCQNDGKQVSSKRGLGKHISLMIILNFIIPFLFVVFFICFIEQLISNYLDKQKVIFLKL